jgi:hypothetical protein
MFEVVGNARQIDYRRAGLFLLAGLALVAGLIYLSAWAGRASVGWLAQQPPYQIPFDRIELVHEPPPWYLGAGSQSSRGSRAFLEGVRSSSREPDHVAMLVVVPDELTAAFKKYAWVKQVARVEYAPGRIRVELRYRQPIAWVQLRGAQQQMLDDEGTILPTENIDVAALGRVLKITGDGGLAPPVATQYGEKWKSKTDAGGLQQVDERILAAAKLAGFLLEEPQAGDAERALALRIDEIIVTDFHKNVPEAGTRGLFVQNAEGAAIWWGEAPGAEKPGRPSAKDKWAMLCQWANTTQARFLKDGDYWEFTRSGIVHTCPHPGARHRPATLWERHGGEADANPKSAKSG